MSKLKLNAIYYIHVNAHSSPLTTHFATKQTNLRQTHVCFPSTDYNSQTSFAMAPTDELLCLLTVEILTRFDNLTWHLVTINAENLLALIVSQQPRSENTTHKKLHVPVPTADIPEHAH